MGGRSTLALLILVLGLAGALYFLEQKDEGPIDEPVESVEPAFDRPGREALRLVLTPGAGLEPFELEREPRGRWDLVEPIRDRASLAVVESLYKQLDGARFILDLDPESVTDEALAQRGLDGPGTALEIGWEDGTSTVLEFGETALSPSEVYVRRRGRPAVYRTSTGLRETIAGASRNGLRDRRIFESEPVGLRRLRIVRDILPELEGQGYAREVTLTWSESERCEVVTDGRSTPAIPGAAFGFASRVLGLRATSFPLGAPSLATPILVVELDAGLGRERVEFFEIDGAQLAKSDRRDVWVAVERGGVESVLAFRFDALRARSMWERPFEDFDSLTVRSPDDTEFTIGRGPLGELVLQRPTRVDLDGRAVDDLLAAMRRMVALPGPDSILDDDALDPARLEALGLGEEAYEVEVRSRVGGPLTQVIRVGEDTSGRVFGQRPSDRFTAQIPPLVLEALNRPWTDYVDKRLLASRQPSSVRSLGITHSSGAAGGGEEARFGRDPNTGVFESDRVEEVLFAVLDAQARSVSERPDLVERPPETRLRLYGVDDRVLVEISVHELADGSRFAVTTDHEGLAFELKSLLADAIESLR